MQTILQKQEEKKKTAAASHLPALRKIKLSIHTFNHAKRDNKKKKVKSHSAFCILSFLFWNTVAHPVV